MKYILFGLALIPALAITTAAKAEDSAPPAAASQNTVDQREANQDKRIENGVKNGQLTQQEAKRLENRQGRIQNAENKALSDGTVSRQEAKKLRRMQNNASRDIYRKKHNQRKH